MCKEFKWRNWSWLLAGLAAGAWTTLAFWPYFDPITGSGTTGSLIWILLNAVLIGMAFFLFPKKGWRILSPFLVLFFLLAGCPMASKAGLNLRLANETDSLIRLSVARTDLPKRRVDFQVSPNEAMAYRTSPGDYPESIELTIGTARHELKATIGQLRTNLVVYTSAGFELRAASKH